MEGALVLLLMIGHGGGPVQPVQPMPAPEPISAWALALAAVPSLLTAGWALWGWWATAQGRERNAGFR